MKEHQIRKKQDQLAKEIGKLCDEFNKLQASLEHVHKIRKTRDDVTSTEIKDEFVSASVEDFYDSFRLNDMAEITNNHKGKKGTRGIIYKLKYPWIHIKTDTGERIYRKYKNMKIVRKK